MGSSKQLLKQLGIAIVATVILIVVGVGSYAVSQQVIPDTNSGTVSPTGTDTPTLSVKVVSQMTPSNVVVAQAVDGIQFRFDTLEKAGAVLYLTPNKSELIQQVVKDWSNGVKVDGSFYTVTPEDSPSNGHAVTISNPDGKIKENEYYYYIILLYNSARIPYGKSNDNLRGPIEPYIVDYN